MKPLKQIQSLEQNQSYLDVKQKKLIFMVQFFGLPRFNILMQIIKV